MTDEARIRDQLVRQLDFLHHSCALFDLGYQDEAIRIATTIRVLLHDSARARKGEGSLLKHLDAKDIHLVTTTPPLDESRNTLFYDGYVNLPGNAPAWKTYSQENTSKISVQNWWSQIIFVSSGCSIRRQHLVLSAANKDGGTHVDRELNKEYLATMQMWTTINRSVRESTPLTDNHLFALRRFGLELLHSPELLNLANLSTASFANADYLVRVAPKSKAIMNQSGLISNHFLRGANFRKENRNKEAAKSIQKAIELVDELRLALVTEMSNPLVYAEQWQQAIEAYETILASKPTDAQSFYGLGYIYTETGEYDIALTMLNKAIDINPNFIPPYKTLLKLYEKLGDKEKAIDICNRILAIAPATPGVEELRDNLLKTVEV